MDFKSGQQLIGLCETNECPISEDHADTGRNFYGKNTKGHYKPDGKNMADHERICPFLC